MYFIFIFDFQAAPRADYIDTTHVTSKFAVRLYGTLWGGGGVRRYFICYVTALLSLSWVCEGDTVS